MIPKDRMVRSRTVPLVVDRHPFAADPPERLVHRTERVGPQHDLVENLARRHRHRHGPVGADGGRGPRARRSTAPSRDDPVRPSPARTDSSAAMSTAASAHPAPRRSAETGRARHGHLLDGETRRRRRHGAHPSVEGRASPACGPRAALPTRRPAHRPRWADASARTRTTSSRENTTRTARPVSSARRRATARHRGGQLAAEGSAVGERRDRFAAGLAPRRVGLEVAGLDERRPQREIPGAGRDLQGMAQGHGGVATRDPLGERPGLAERLAHHPAAAAVGHRHQRVGGSGVLGESPASDTRRRRRPSGPCPLRARPGAPRRRGRVAPRLRRRRRASTRRTRRPGARRRRSCAIRCTDTDGRAGRAPTASSSGTPRRAPRAARRMMIPGVQKPHWLAPTAVKASAQPVADARGRARRGWSPRARPPAGPG